MKEFNAIIQENMEQRADSDPLFAPKFSNPNKSIAECCRYILGEARKRGNAVFMSDDEVFGMAIHYYDEENIKVDGSGNYNVSSGHPIAKPKEGPNQLSIQYPKQTISPLKRGKAKKEGNKLQLSLFDELWNQEQKYRGW